MAYLVYFATETSFGHLTFHETEEAAQVFYRAFLIWSILSGNLDDDQRSALEAMDEDALYKLHEAEGGFEGFYEPVVLMTTTNLTECYAFLPGD
jgi:hypothetical protein